MFRRTSKEPMAEDASDSIAPWEMLEEAGIATWTAQVRAYAPLRALTAFARRIDQETVACFDKGTDGQGKAVVVLRHLDDPAQTKELSYTGFGAWFDDALAAAKIWHTQR